jgi:hypothetical protein
MGEAERGDERVQLAGRFCLLAIGQSAGGGRGVHGGARVYRRTREASGESGGGPSRRVGRRSVRRRGEGAAGGAMGGAAACAGGLGRGGRVGDPALLFLEIWRRARTSGGGQALGFGVELRRRADGFGGMARKPRVEAEGGIYQGRAEVV